MTAPTKTRRRSERLWLTVPLHAQGTDLAGEDFEVEARAINFNRHGARIQVLREFAPNHLFRLESPDGKHRADFRVVEVIAPQDSQEVEYGAECLNQRQNFWQIEFPPPEDVEAEVSRVLLECTKCNTMALLPLTLSEVQAVRTMGWVGKSCPICAALSLWKYAQVGRTLNPKGAQNVHHESSSWISAAVDCAGRNHRRVYVIMPVAVRDAQGNQVTTRTENVSKGGFCFASERNYKTGEVVTAIFENVADSLTHKTELPAQIVREQAILGAHRKLYGAAYC
ncbi:MAG TPA: PilZ domain-containing protein [Terriglobia bacterium]|nr:PilZ domain-containing protein [Terriglobia bacterium]